MNEPLRVSHSRQSTQIMYGNRIITTDNVNQDLETLKCYHDIKAGKHQSEMVSMPLEKVTVIQEWCLQVEQAFGLGK